MKINILEISLFAFLFIGSLHSFAQEAPDEIIIHIEHIEAALEAGEITEEEADAKIDELLIGVWGDDDWLEDLPEETQGEIERIDAALEAGEITEEEADTEIDGLLIGVWSDDDWLEDLPEETQGEIERIEAALEAGKITEKEADSKIDELLIGVWDDDDQLNGAELEDGSIVNEEAILSEIPFALIEPLLEMMAAIDWDNISDWIQVGLEIDQLFKKEWGEGENLEVKKKMKNQIIGELKSSPQTLIKDLSKQANSKSASAKLQYGLSIRSGSGILIMKFEGHLQTAPTAIGPWTDIEATGSLEVQTDIGSAFFRSKK